MLCVCLALLHFPSHSYAADGHICDQAARTAAEQTGVPASVLLAITRTETGRSNGGTISPWPWTVNMEGKGVWFKTRDKAQAYAFENYKRGARSFDVGCFQINFKWHGAHFISIEQMFEPLPNALYAARFLKDLYRELGGWTEAAGAYHSRTKKFADKYLDRYQTILAGLPAAAESENTAALPQRTVRNKSPLAARVNRFPLLVTGTGGASSPGSLFPSQNTGGTGSMFAYREG